ncbi:FUSC family protein [Clostridium perfringens]|uniref:FUSC family protein n=1 Tax=Clostridium perfringens TaxID=1502 RepID=UPI002ED38D9C|nr:FUSC family protein [Clostridium perfringens]
MWKKQIMYLKMFLIVVISILIFVLLFGKENLFIGLAAVITVTTMFGEDYTINPIHHTLYFTGVELFVGLGAYFAGLNPILGAIMTLIVSFFIYFSFTYDTKPTKALGFIQLYLFLLYEPVTTSELPKRVFALVFGGIVIMTLYYILARYNFNNIFNKSIKGCINSLIENLNELINTGCIEKNNSEKVALMIKELEIKVYERLELDKNQVYSIYSKDLIVVFLKRVSSLSSEAMKRDVNKELIKKTIELLKNVQDFIEDGNKEKLKNILNEYYNYLDSFKLRDDLDRYSYYNAKLSVKEFLQGLNVKENQIESYSNYIANFLKALKSNSNNFRKSLNIRSLRFNLAVKAAITLAFSVFIVNYFEIFQGKWALFTISLLLIPYAEQSNKKAKARVLGTIIGAILFNVIFYFIQSNVILIFAFIVVCIYLSMSVVSYKIRCIFITLNALLMAGVMDPSHTPYYVLSEYRVFSILIASIIVAIVMNYIFPYKMKDETNKAIKLYVYLNERILDGLIEENSDKEKLILSFFESYRIWKKINYNNKEMKSEQIQELLILQNDFVSDVNFLIKSPMIHNNKSLFKKSFEDFKNYTKKKDFEDLAIEDLEKAKTEEERLILVLLYKLFYVIKEMRKLSDLICKE